MLKNIFIIMILCTVIVCGQEKSTSFGLQPRLGITYTNSSKASGDNENLEWLFNLQSNFNYKGESFDFDADLLIVYGQMVRAGLHPEKTQDAFTLNLMPSIKLCDNPGLRLFLQIKAETQLSEGTIDNQQTNFLDPLFLTNTLFLGQKNNLIETTPDQQLKLTYGIGYSFQQIITNHFIVAGENSSNNNVEFINGPTAVFNIDFSKQITEDLKTGVSLNSLFLIKKDFFQSTSNSRFTAQIVANFDYKFISLQYINCLIYDKALSNRRQLDQSLVLGVKLDL